MTLQGVPCTKQILMVLTFMHLNVFMIGPEIKELLAFEVGTPTARHPVCSVAGKSMKSVKLVYGARANTSCLVFHDFSPAMSRVWRQLYCTKSAA